MSAHGTCAACERGLEILAGAGEPTCVNVRCYAAPMIDDSAIIRIVIELRPHIGIVSTWWKSPHLGALDSLRWFHAMIGAATSHLPNVIRAGMAALARWN